MVVTTVAAEISWLFEVLVDRADTLDPAVLTASPGPHAPPIAFHVWHVARWSDRLAAEMPRLLGRSEPGTRAEDIWTREAWAARWGLNEELGRHASGWGLADEIAGTLPWPRPSVFLGYVRPALQACREAVDDLVDDDLERSCADLYDEESTVGEVVILSLIHI